MKINRGYGVSLAIMKEVKTENSISYQNYIQWIDSVISNLGLVILTLETAEKFPFPPFTIFNNTSQVTFSGP